MRRGVLTAVAAVTACAGVLAVPVAGASAAPTAPAPDGFVTLVDDTGALSVAVPGEWTDVDTTPGSNDDGTTMPWISASTDFAAYRAGFDVPGVAFIGVTYTTDLQSWIDRLGVTDLCGAESVQPYDDGAFVGLDATYTECGDAGTATFRLVAANAGDDTTRSYVIQVQSPTAADLGDVEPVLASFSAVGITSAVTPAEADSGDAAAPEEVAPGAAGAPQPGVPAVLPDEVVPPAAVTLPDGSQLLPALPPGAAGASTTTMPSTATTSPPGEFTPTNAVAPGAVGLVDDSRTLSVSVPPDWAQSATEPNAEGQPRIEASTDLALYRSAGPEAFTVPGVSYGAFPYSADSETVATNAAATLACTAAPAQPYRDPVFTGHIVQLTACGGTSTRAYVVVASPASQAMTVVVLVQVTDPDDSDLQTVLSTFNVDPTAAAVGTATTLAPAVTTTVTATTPATAPATTVPSTAPATTGPVGGPTTTVAAVFSPSVSAPADTVAVVDDSGFLRVGVPPAWAQRDTATGASADGTPSPHIAASPDLAAFLASPSAYAVPGVLYQAAPFTADTQALVSAVAAGHQCIPGIVQQYRDSVFTTGTIQELTGCGGTTTRVFVVAASPADSSFTALLTIVVTDDPVVLNTVLATFNYDASANPFN